MLNRWISIGCVLACTGAFTVSAKAQISNGGFETGDFSGWTVGGTAESGVAAAGSPISGTSIKDNYVRVGLVGGGNFAAFAKLQSVTPPSVFSLEQTIDVEPATAYNFGLSFGVFGDPTVAYKQFWSFQVYIDDVAFGGPSSGSSTAGGYITSTHGGYRFADGDTSAKVRFELKGSGLDGALAGFSVDNVFVRPLPEPSGLAMLAIGAALLGRRRRLL